MRVRHFLEIVREWKDQTFVALVEQIRADDDADGMNNQFDKCVQHLLPACPVLARQKSGNNNEANIGAAKISSIQIKSGRGKTGVDLRWYKQLEFKKLTKDQKEELIAWGKTQEGLAAKQA